MTGSEVYTVCLLGLIFAGAGTFYFLFGSWKGRG